MRINALSSFVKEGSFVPIFGVDWFKGTSDY
jgi:hypothetical protein